MFILRNLLKSIQSVSPDTDNGRERFAWFACAAIPSSMPTPIPDKVRKGLDTHEYMGYGSDRSPNGLNARAGTPGFAR